MGTKMLGMFDKAAHFNQDVSKWNTGAVTDMSYMFYEASAFNQDVSKWNTGVVTTMRQMFRDASAFKQLLCSPHWRKSEGLFAAAESDHSRVLCCTAGSHLKVDVDP